MDRFQTSIDGKIFAFGGLVPLLGTTATERLTRGWAQEFCGYTQSVSSMYFRAFTRFLRWLAARAEISPTSAEARFLVSFQNGETGELTKFVVYEAGEAWASRLRDTENFEIARTASLFTRVSLIETIGTCLKRLANAGLWEDPGKFAPLVRGSLNGGNIPSFGELHKVNDVEDLRGWVRPTYDNLDWREVIRLNEQRLQALRDVCVRDLKAGIGKFEAGQHFLSDPEGYTPCDVDELIHALRNLHLRGRIQSPQELQLRRARGLKIMVRYLAFTEPHRRSFNDWRGTAIIDHGRAAGGWVEAMAHVEGDIRSLIAAQTIVMIDTAFNVSTCDNLAAEPFFGDVKRGKVRILTVSAAKLRALGELQEGEWCEGADIDVRRKGGEISGADAIRAWQRMSGRVRRTAAHLKLPAVDHLWIVPGYKSDRDRIARLSPAAANYHWRAMLLENYAHPVLGRVPIRRQMIRPTVLQLRASRGGFEYDVASKLAQHKQSSTTMRYLSRPWFKALLDLKMRTFLEAFQAGLVAPMTGASEALGIAPGVQYRHLDHAKATGLGFLCTVPRETGASMPSEEPCAEIDRCAGCSFRQFKPDRESIRALTLFRFSLRDQEESFKAANPARWAEVWLSFQALCEVIADRLRDSHHGAQLKKAEAEIEADLAVGAAHLVQLW